VNDYNCRRLRSGNIRGNIIFIFAAQKSLRAFLSCFFTKKGRKGKDRQIAQGDYEQERAK
jgi:hypothetical protein